MTLQNTKCNCATAQLRNCQHFRMQKDRLIEKVSEYVENGTTKAKYKKTGVGGCTSPCVPRTTGTR